MAKSTCNHPDGCPRLTHGRSDYCKLHYTRLRKSGELGPVGLLVHRNKGQSCAHPDGCPKPAWCKGLCITHYARVKSGGDIGPVGSLKKKYNAHIYTYKELRAMRTQLLEEQGGRCAMSHCDASVDDESVAWQMDHDHSCENHPTKRMCSQCVRGVLCSFCNMSLLGPIEAAGDPLEVTKSVLSYLEASATQLEIAS